MQRKKQIKTTMAKVLEGNGETGKMNGEKDKKSSRGLP